MMMIIIIIIMNVVRNASFSQSLLCNSACRWSQGIFRGYYSLQVYLEVESSGSQLGEKPMKTMYCVSDDIIVLLSSIYVPGYAFLE